MAISYDNTAGVVASGTGNLSWTHTGAASGVKGVVVQIVQNAQTNDQINSVTYGTLTLTRVAGATVFHTAGVEDGAVYTYVGTSGIPQGAQTVNVAVTASGANKDAHSYTFLATGDTRVIASNTADTANTGGTTASVNLVGSAGIGALSVGLLHSSINNPANMSAGGAFSEVEEVDLGNQTASWTRLTTITTGTITHAWTVTANTEAGIGAVALVDTALTSDPTTEVTTLLDSLTAQKSLSPLTETMALGHSVLRLAGIILLESLTLTDPVVAANRSYSKELTETATVADAAPITEWTSSNKTKELTDTLALSHDTLSLVGIELREITSIADLARHLAAGRTLAEQLVLPFELTLSEQFIQELVEQLVLPSELTLSEQFIQEVTEQIFLAGVATNDSSRAIAEVATLTDTVVKGGTYARTLTETASVVDATVTTDLNGGYSKELTEQVSLADDTLKLSGIILLESASVADAPVQTVASGDEYVKELTDIISLTDDTLTLTGIILRQTLTLTDTCQTWPVHLTLQESLTITAPELIRGFELTETLGLVDPTLTFNTHSKTLTESVGLIDVWSKASQAARTFVETATLSDDLSTGGYSKTLTEQLGLLDGFTRQASRQRTLVESTSLSDSLLKGSGKTLSEVTSLTASLLYFPAWYRATDLDFATGSIVSGVLSDTWNDASPELVLGEAQAPTDPAFGYVFRFGEFFPAPNTKLTITVKGWYDGNLGHQVHIYQYYFPGPVYWVRLTTATTDFPDQTSQQTYQFTLIDDPFYYSQGNLYVLIQHDSPGQNTHQLHINGMFLSQLADPSDTATLTDSLLIVQTAKNLLETISLGENVTKEKSSPGSYQKELLETIGLTAAWSKASGAARTLSEAVALSDSVTRQITSRTLAESLALTDSLKRQDDRTISEALTLGGSLIASQASKILAEQITLGESVTKEKTSPGSYQKELAETVNLGAVWSKASASARILTQTLMLSESVRKAPSHTLSDGIAAQAALRRDAARGLLELIVLSARPSKHVSLTESLTLTEGAAPHGPETGLITLLDALSTGLDRALSESTSLSDSIITGTGLGYYKVLTELLALSDTMAGTMWDLSAEPGDPWLSTILDDSQNSTELL